MRLGMLAVGMLLGRKVKLTEIASKLGVSGQSVYNWAHAWHDKGVCGLLVGHKGGHPLALSDAMIGRGSNEGYSRIAEYLCHQGSINFWCNP